MEQRKEYLEKKDNVNRKFYLSPSFYGALIFAIALWVYTILNEDYQTNVSVPLKIQLPETKAIEKDIPENLNILVKGSGWNLFNLIYFNTAKQCNVNLNGKDLPSDYYQVTRQEIIKSIELFQNIETRDIIPDYVDLYYGTIATKLVDVVPQIDIETPENFIQSDSIIVNPTKIEIKGNKKIIDKIDKVYTQLLSLNELSKSINAKIPIIDTLSSIVEFNTKNVNIKIDIQQKSSIILDNISVPNLFISNSLKIPDKIKAVITSGVDDLAQLNINEIEKNIYFVQLDEYPEFYLVKSDLPSKYKVTFFPKFVKIIKTEKYL